MGLFSWSEFFGNSNPVEIEIGPGRGEFLLARAAAERRRNFLALERHLGRAASLEQECATRGLQNVRVVAADARCVISHVVPTASVDAYHIYFPDPWPKNRHRKRRLVTPAFAAELARTLRPGGYVRLASDLEDYLARMVTTLAAAGLDPAGPDYRAGIAPLPLTRYARKYARRPEAIHVAVVVRPARGA